MSSAARTALAFSLTCLLATVAAGVAQADTPEDDIARAVRQLGDDDFSVREKATALLRQKGHAARTALRAALQSKDLEVVRRARTLLNEIKHIPAPGTSQDVAALLVRYCDAREQYKKEAILASLLNKGGKAFPVLLDLFEEEEEPNLRKEIFQSLSPSFLLAEGRPAEAEHILAEAAEFRRHRRRTVPQVDADLLRDQAALLLASGRSDAKLAELRARALKSGGEAATVLAYLYRARRDLANARRFAEAAGDEELLTVLLTEQGDWAELAARTQLQVKNGAQGVRLRYLGIRAVYLRLAGADEDYRKAVAEIRRTVPEESDDRAAAWPAAAALLLVDQPPAEVCSLLRAHQDTLRRFELLCAQLRFREAFALEDQGAVSDPIQWFWLPLSRACALVRLGERRQARVILERVFLELKAGASRERWRILFETECSLGFSDLALDHCGGFFAMAGVHRVLSPTGGDPPREELAAAALTPQARYSSALWWNFLAHQDTEAAALPRTRDLLQGRWKPAEARALIQQAEEAWFDPATSQDYPVRIDARTERLAALAEASQAAGLKDMAGAFWLKWATGSDNDSRSVSDDSPEPCLRLAELAAEQKDWLEAAEWYRQAWLREPRAPLPFFLRGQALVQAGRKEEGRKCMALAHEIPLGDQAKRLQFARQLQRSGLTDDALREYERGLRVGAVENFFEVSAALAALGRAATARGDFRKAAEYHERVRLLCLEWNLGRIRSGLYLVLCHRVHHQRAGAALAAGRVEEALREIRLCRDLLPGDLDLPIAIVPDLEAKGRHREAEELLDSVFALYERLAADYPRCAWAHHAFAWLAACSHRRLDAALEHARKAAELQPGDRLYLDTLAEVHFQRGDKGRAVELMKKCLAQEPTSAYFAAQLRRFAAGDPKAPLPAETPYAAKADEACLLDRDIFADGDTVSLSGRCLLKGSLNTSVNGFAP